jgi:hypothetical protein
VPIFKTLPRIIGLTVLTGAGVLAQQGVAHASVAVDAATTNSDTITNVAPGSHLQMLAEKYGTSAISSKDDAKASTAGAAAQAPSKAVVSSSSTSTSCAGSDAIKSVTYTVDGKVVPSLSGHVAQGSEVTATFVLKDGCDNTQVGLAAYQAPSNVWDASIADQQVLVDHQGGTYSAGKSYTLTVTAPSCDFQVDFFTGPVLDKLSATAGYNIPNGNLIDADNGGTETCVPPVVTPPAPPVKTDTCPADESARITGYTWTINGVPGFTTLTGNVKPGDKVEVDFTVAAGCDDEQLSLASYSAPSDSFDASTADQQVLIDSQTGTFTAGEHSMAVNVDACFYQVDFVHGGVLTHLGPEGSNNFYSGNLIESANGGAACVTPPPAPQVEAESIVAKPAAQQLAFTGGNTQELVMIGMGLTMLGAALERASARMRRRTA